MKKISLIIALILTIFSSKAQEEIDFKVGYLPNFSYILTQDNSSEYTMRFIGSEEMLSRLESEGVKNPEYFEENQRIKSITRSGDLKEGQFPLNMEILESQDPNLVAGTILYGNYIDRKMKLDSIASSVITEEQKEVMMPVMESILNQLDYPEGKIKLEKSFEHKLPMSFPIGGILFEFEINSIYTLKKIAYGIGYFDLVQEFIMKLGQEEYKMNMKGSGKGNLLYDIEKEFFIKYFLEAEMLFEVNIEGVALELEMNTVTAHNVEVVYNGD